MGHEVPGKHWRRTLKANAPREIMGALVVGLAVGMVWKNWHDGYQARESAYYRWYQQQEHEK